MFITIKSVWPLEASPDDFVFFSISTMSSAELDALLQRGAATLKSASGLEVPDTPEDAMEKENLDAPLSSLVNVEHKGITPTKVKSLTDKVTLIRRRKRHGRR